MYSDFFSRHPVLVAHDLIGCTLAVTRNGMIAGGRIVETEAYAGPRDAASHSARFRVARDIMSRQPGTVYVYRSYGIHVCLNLVAHMPGDSGAVLIRAIEPEVGIDVMQRRRGNVPTSGLLRGPGNVGQALAISLADSGTDSLDGTWLRLESGQPAPPVLASPRIGISKAIECPWRFFDPASAAVSGHRRGELVTGTDIPRLIGDWANSVE